MTVCLINIIFVSLRMEFADFDDDLFLEERQRNNIDEEYAARYCEDSWFLKATPECLVSEEDNLSVLKYSADYLFYKKEYENAISKYEEILSVLPTSNTTVRRECYEGIARSFIKCGQPEKAVAYAVKLHSTSKTQEQATVSCSVLIDANIAAEKYVAALEISQMMVSLHPYHADAWLKLGYIYAGIYGVEVPCVKKLLVAALPYQTESRNETSGESCSHEGKVNIPKPSHNPEIFPEKLLTTNSSDVQHIVDGTSNHMKNNFCECISLRTEEKGIQFVCACFYRSFAILKRTEGTTFGFALESSLKFQKHLLCDMKSLLDEFSLYSLKCKVDKCDHCHDSASPQRETTSEFIDRGSSKFQPEETDLNVDISSKHFVTKWFSCIK
ncbi:hypothetical protein SK128_025509 [Halocaridina rubra]|uniref:Uncharacterized protein n=1 Tax=Halocaridina rubra TaxID=373956 RepID=A0AAN8ZV70_HALRR